MRKKVHETIIIGAGISGLSCARKLHENKKEFLVISEDIGGRILTSEDGKVNYGAYWVMDNWHNIKRFLKKTRKLCLAKMYYHDRDASYNFWNINMIIYLPQIIKIIYLFHKFKKRLDALRRKCEYVSQKQALSEEPFLSKLYNQNIIDFVEEQGIKEAAEIFWKNPMESFYFLPFDKLDAFHVLLVMSSLTIPSYEFVFQKNRMIKDFKRKILIDTVIGMVKKKDHYIIKTKKNSFCAKNLVVATPIHVSKELLGIKKIKGPAPVRTFHVSGRIRERWRHGRYHWFAYEEPIYVIARQTDESYFIYAKRENAKLDKYFYEYKVIGHKFWNPAFNSEGSLLLECKQDENLYLIGDHNIMNVEDSYITGMYAANRIINSKG